MMGKAGKALCLISLGFKLVFDLRIDSMKVRNQMPAMDTVEIREPVA
jgi:hypothetical protein